MDIDPYVQGSQNKTFRRMAWCVMVNFNADCTLSDAWLQLSDAIKPEANKYGMIMASAQRGGHKCRVVLLFKGNGGADKILKPSGKWNAFKMSAKDPVPFAKALLRSPDVIYTITLEESSHLQKVTAMEAIQPFLPLDEISFKATLIDLKEKKRVGALLTPEEEFMVNHSRDVEKLKELLLWKERMRTMLKDVDSALRFPWDLVINDDTVRVFHIEASTLKRRVAQRPVDASLNAVGLYTIVFFGAPGKGKTPAAH